MESKPLDDVFESQKQEINQRIESAAVTDDTITISPGSRFRAAMVLAMMADALAIEGEGRGVFAKPSK
jgi:hypothetical protein